MALFETNELKIYNSVTSEKDIFQPLNAPLVGLYVCGPTVYSDVHLGNCRTFISFDMVFRYLQHLGYKVRYVRNITDAGHLENDADEGEDKIAQKARLEQLEPMEIVQKYTVGFHDVMERFNAFPPSIEPTATGHIVEQIEMIKEILDAGLAYEVNGSVYFDVQKYNENKHYGKISGRKIEELFEGTRDLDGQSDKKSSLDFALWKKASPSHIMRWPSPWGVGFPGWHLECSVMSTKYLGEAFDIHGGGMDLKFPHHECEVAQNQAAKGSDGAQVWMHANMLTLNGKRMSKSTGNTLLPYELFTGDTDKLEKGFHPSVVRFFMHQAHYRSVLDFSNDALIAAEKGYMRLMEALDTLERVKASSQGSWDLKAWKQECYDAMNDDFNSPILIAKLFDAVRQINSIADGKASLTQSDLEELKSTLNAFIFDVLGLQRTEGVASDGSSIDGVMAVLLDIRKDARANRDFAMSDKIRDELAERGIILKDGKDGTTYIIES